MAVKNNIASTLGLLFPPCTAKNFLLRQLGWKIGSECKIGFSWINCGNVQLHNNVAIGHGNYIKCRTLVLRDDSCIQHLNLIKGDIWIFLLKHAAIGNLNKVNRAKRGVTWGRSVLRLGVYSKITSRHVVDCTRSVRLGNYSTIAGLGSQIWTHGYLHAPSGLDRFRIDGSVNIGNNVYIGSASVINAAVKIGSAITVGACSCVSKSLLEQGLYVSQPLRKIESDYESSMQRYPEVEVEGLIEKVFNKKP